MNKMKLKAYSKNERAEKIVGLRNIPGGSIPFDQPCELGYHCPVCKYSQTILGNYDERLEWSEYNSFLWCSVCNKDYPTCLCVPMNKKLPPFLDEKSAIDYAIKIYLDSIVGAKNSRATKARKP